jgi:hypothetical protein
MAPKRVEVRRLADEAVPLFYALNKVQPEFVLKEARRGLRWLTNLPFEPFLYGAGPRVLVNEWPESTRMWYPMATRTRTSDEMACWLIRAAKELAADGVQWIHEGRDLTPPYKVQTRTVATIPTPHLLVKHPETKIEKELNDDWLRSGELAVAHSFVRFNSLGPVADPVAVYLDLSYAQFGNQREYYLGTDRTLDGICQIEHVFVPHEDPFEEIRHHYVKPIIPMAKAVRELVKAVNRSTQ